MANYVTEKAVQDLWNKLPQEARRFFGTYEAYKAQYLKSENAQIAGTTNGDGTGEGPDIYDTGDETVISGLPLFNKPLRTLLSSLFTNALATASRDASQGVGRTQILNQGAPTDFLGEWLKPFLKAGGIPKTPTNNSNTTQPVEPGAGGSGGFNLSPFEVVAQEPNQSGGPGPNVLPPPETYVGPTRTSGTLGTPTQAAPTASGDNNIISTLFNSLLGGQTTRRLPTTTASPGLGEIAAIGSLVKQLFGGQPEQPAQAVNGATSAFEPSFENPNSLASFMQLLQMFGAGSGQPFGGSPAQGYQSLQVGASPAQGVMTSDQGLQEFLSGINSGSGTNTSGTNQLVSNPFTDIMSAFSLPSYQGPYTAQSTPLQQQATDYASEFLRSGNQTGLMGQDTLQELITTGGRFDNSPQFAALEGITNRRMEESKAQINENFGSQGLRYGSDVARGQGGLAAELLAQESLQRAQIAQQSFENATNRRLQALGLAPQVTQGNLQNAQTAYGIGEGNRQIQDTGIQRQMAEFARTQGGFFPLLLQFALAGTEGDTVVLE
jgi:hypothetical protein